jgi:hypothetical protein
MVLRLAVVAAVAAVMALFAVPARAESGAPALTHAAICGR